MTFSTLPSLHTSDIEKATFMVHLGTVLAMKAYKLIALLGLTLIKKAEPAFKLKVLCDVKFSEMHIKNIDDGFSLEKKDVNI